MLLALITVILSFGAVGSDADDDDEFACGNFMTYSLDNGTLTISGEGDMYGYLTTTVNGVKVTNAPWGQTSAPIKNLVVGNGVTSIGKYAFYGCSALVSVSLPDTLNSIGADAFYGCKLLKSINIPSSVNSIGTYAFYGCKALTAMDMHAVSTIGAYSFYGCTALKTVDLGSASTVGLSAFRGCTALTSANLSSVTSIDSYVFYGCKLLNNVVLGPVVTISGYSFYGCKALVSLDLPEAVSTIGDYAFNGCTALVDIDLSNLVTIGNYAFNGCTALVDLSLDSAMSIGVSAFAGCTAISHISFPPMSRAVDLGSDFTVNISASGEKPEYSITPSQNGRITMASYGNKDTYGYLFYNGTQIAANDDGGNECNFSISYNVEAGKTYTLRVKLYSTSAIGSFGVTVTGVPATVSPSGGSVFSVSSDSFNGLTFYESNKTTVINPLAQNLSDTEFFGAGDGKLYAFDPLSVIPHTHVPGDLTVVSEPTCTASGTSVICCTDCGEVLETYTVSALGHTRGEPVTVFEPTCTAPGSIEVRCTVCNQVVETTGTSALGHAIVDHIAKTATCTEHGWDAYVTCDRCDYTTYNEVAALGHTEGEPVVVTVPTCTDAGVSKIYCTVCNELLETVTVTALGHDLVNHAAKAATCTEHGWDAYVTCDRCDYTTYNEVAALGHNIVHYDASAPALGKDGWNAYDACSRGDYTTKVTIPAYEFAVTYLIDGNEYAIQYYRTGDVLAYPENPVENVDFEVPSYYDEYIFAGWDVAEGTAVGSTMDVNAVITKVYSLFTVSFEFGEYSVTYKAGYGSSVTVPPMIPYKAPVDGTTYAFAGWDGYTEGMTVENDLVFTAVFTENNKYTVEIIFDNGNSETISVIGGQTVPNDVGVLEYYKDENYHGQWFGSNAITGDTTLYAVVTISDEINDDVSWYLDASTGFLTITGEGKIPDYKYASSTPWYAFREHITDLEIGDGITYIGKHAFQHCCNLVSVNLSDTVEKIMEDAFKDTPINNIVFGTGLVYLEDAFEDLHGAFVEVSGTLDNGVTWTLTEAYGSLCITGIEYNAGDDVPVVNVENSEIPDFDAIYDSPWYMFRKYIENIYVGEDILRIGKNAFIGLENLQQVAIPLDAELDNEAFGDLVFYDHNGNVIEDISDV
ncbi:MAG: leucine-rich repeat domain-containing protein, partial [archaeon]|nr:leucine-rich repeat domain-containing protein [archaeon]